MYCHVYVRSFGKSHGNTILLKKNKLQKENKFKNFKNWNNILDLENMGVQLITFYIHVTIDFKFIS